MSEREKLEYAITIIQETVDRLKAEEEIYNNLPPKEVVEPYERKE